MNPCHRIRSIDHRIRLSIPIIWRVHGWWVFLFFPITNRGRRRTPSLQDSVKTESQKHQDNLREVKPDSRNTLTNLQEIKPILKIYSQIYGKSILILKILSQTCGGSNQILKTYPKTCGRSNWFSKALHKFAGDQTDSESLSTNSWEIKPIPNMINYD
jgi:hypothetical protein